MHITTHTPIPNDKLSPWLFAVRHAQAVLNWRITHAEENGLPCGYDRMQLDGLDDLEQFLSMSWTDYMDKLEDNIKELTEAMKDA